MQICPRCHALTADDGDLAAHLSEHTRTDEALTMLGDLVKAALPAGTAH